MKTIQLKEHHIKIPQMALGCMRIDSLSKSELKKHVETAIDLGMNHFDHADIYGGGLCETLFGDAMSSLQRDKLIIQSKCGIRPGHYDLSKDYIIQSVDEILKRLKTDYLDILSLHRPDALLEPDDIAEAFDKLKTSGKVKHFGVSNMNGMQIDLIKKSVEQPIELNQLQLSLARTGMIDAGLNVNMKTPASVDHDGQVLTYCQVNDIGVQAWSPFQYGFFEGIFINNDQFPKLNAQLKQLAEIHNTNPSAIAVAWLLRHPAGIQAIIGTTNTDRLIQISQASHIELSRKEWYDLYTSVGNMLP